MTSSSSNAEDQTANKTGFIKTLVIIGIPLIFLGLWILGVFQPDPYISTTLSLKGSEEKGSLLFRMNCVGCHGVAARGHLAPDLHGITKRYSDAEIINQIIKGQTPPMPSFQIEAQPMADLMAYLNSI